MTARVSVPGGRLAAMCRDIGRGIVGGWALIREYPLTACSLVLFAVVWLK